MRRLPLFLSVLLLIAAEPIMLRAQPHGFTPPTDTADTTAWERYFSAWEASSPTDAQLWIDRFNHFFNRSKTSVLVLRGTEDEERLPGESDNRLILQDSTGRTAGILSGQTRFDDRLFAQALAAIDRGIELHPDRLDMHLGRAAACRYAQHWEAMGTMLCNLLDRAEQDEGAWLAPDGSPQPIAPATLIADWLQGYVNSLLDASTSDPRNAADRALERLVVRETEYCPTSAVACNNRAVWLSYTEDVDQTLHWLIRASQAAPDDALIVYNIGYLYAMHDKREEARHWWSKLLDSSDEYYRNAAAESLRQLDTEQ